MIYTDQVLLKESEDLTYCVIESSGLAPEDDTPIVERGDSLSFFTCIGGIVNAIVFESEHYPKEKMVCYEDRIECFNTRGISIPIHAFLNRHPDMMIRLNKFFDSLFFENDETDNLFRNSVEAVLSNNIILHNKQAIHDLSDWETICFSGKKKKHWKENQSAQSLAEFILFQDGLNHIKSIISPITGMDLSIYRVEPEREIRFDSNGHGREHDLAIWAITNSSKKVFIGVEAKVDEKFGNDTVKEHYSKACEAQEGGENTNLPKRIEELMNRYVFRTDPQNCNIQYQLLPALAGTLAPEADIHILLILEFPGERTEEVKKKQKDNWDAFQFFIGQIKSNKIGEDLYHYQDKDKRELFIFYKDRF